GGHRDRRVHSGDGRHRRRGGASARLHGPEQRGDTVHRQRGVERRRLGARSAARALTGSRWPGPLSWRSHGPTRRGRRAATGSAALAWSSQRAPAPEGDVTARGRLTALALAAAALTACAPAEEPGPPTAPRVPPR